MSSIGQFTFDAWNGRIFPQQGQYDTLLRSGLAGYGIGFDADMNNVSRITTRVLIPSGTEVNLYTQYRAMERTNVTVIDGFGSVWRNALIIQVAQAELDQCISPVGYVMLTAQWLILPDIV